MKNYLSIALIFTTLLGIPMLSGCDDKATTSKETVHTNADGTTSVDKSKTTTDSHGNSSTSTEHRTSP